MKKLILLAALAGLLSACPLSDWLKPDNANSAIANVGLEYLTVKVVKQAQNPASLAADAREVMATIRGAESGAPLSLDALDALVEKWIQATARTPEDLLLFETVRQTARADLQDRLKTAPTLTLSSDDWQTVDQVLADIEAGIKFAGY